MTHDRPEEPTPGKHVWYRGWELGFSYTAAAWSGYGYYACLGGADLDCIQITARTWADLLDEVDEHGETEQ